MTEMGADDANSREGLTHYVDVLRRRKWPLMVCVLLAVGAAVAIPLLQKPLYRGRADVVLHLDNSDIVFDVNAARQTSDPARLLPTEIRVLRSQEVRKAATQLLGFVPGAVAARPVPQTNVISVSATNATPEVALRIAKAYASAYIELRRSQAVNNLLAASEQVQNKVADLQQQIEGATGAQRDTLVQAQALFKQRLDQLQVDAALKTGGAELVTPISGATSRVNPGLVQTVVAGLGVGLAIGFALTLLLEHLDDSLKVKEDLERFAPGLQVLGLIPAVRGWRSTGEAVVVSISEPESQATEAYRSLRTVIQFLGQQSPLRVIQVTSPNAQEGKSSTVANLAVALARAGQRVIIVCCDLRRPRIHEFFDLDNSVGFTSVLRREMGLTSALQRVEQQAGLRVLASGPQPKNPAEVLASRRAKEVFEAIRLEADFVLIDSPPVLPVTDALVLSSMVDAIVLVAAHGVTSGREVARATELLRQVEAPLVGAVLNGVTGSGTYGDGDGYYTRSGSGTQGRFSAREAR